jgi:hypothetical protein
MPLGTLASVHADALAQLRLAVSEHPSVFWFGSRVDSPTRLGIFLRWRGSMPQWAHEVETSFNERLEGRGWLVNVDDVGVSLQTQLFAGVERAINRPKRRPVSVKVAFMVLVDILRCLQKDAL